MKYRIDIKEILLKTIEVEADNHFEAIGKVKKKYNNGDIVLDTSDHFCRCEMVVDIYNTENKYNIIYAEQIIDCPVGRHSSKPSIVRDKIIELLGDLPRIELFAREQADGWNC